MSSAGRSMVSLSTQVVDVSPTVVAAGPEGVIDINDSMVRLLHEMLHVQRQQVELTRELLQFTRENRQRQQAELEAWQRDNQGVVERCREVLGTLSRIHSALLGDMADHINENEEMLLENDFSMSEFVDRFGPRLHHLSAMLSVFKQVSTPSSSEQGQGTQGS